MKRNTSLVLLMCLVSGAIVAAPKSSAAPKPPAEKKRAAAATAPAAAKPAPPPKVEPPLTPQPLPPEPEAQALARVVRYGEKDVVPVRTKIRYTTMLILPKNEQILDFTCGDKEFWVINGSENIAFVKPAKAGAQTNLNLVTGSGNIYSFLLNEFDSEPDLKIFVEPKEQSMITTANRSPRFVAARELEDARRRTEVAKEETKRTRQAAEAAIETANQKYVMSLRFAYRFDAGKKPFRVQAIYHDNRFTYIEAQPSETPTLYEIRDGKPNLITFEFRGGKFVIHKILDKGYLAIGKHKFHFARRED